MPHTERTAAFIIQECFLWSLLKMRRDLKDCRWCRSQGRATLFSRFCCMPDTERSPTCSAFAVARLFRYRWAQKLGDIYDEQKTNARWLRFQRGMLRNKVFSYQKASRWMFWSVATAALGFNELSLLLQRSFSSLDTPVWDFSLILSVISSRNLSASFLLGVLYL